MTRTFTRTFVAEPQHIDELGHVNNTVWVQWIQDMATAHWDVSEGAEVTATTWIEGPAMGAKSLRRVEFTDASGKRLVSAATTWAMLDRATGRLARVRPEVLAPFRAA